MNSEAFRRNGKRIIDFIADYHKSLRQRPVRHQVKKGFLVKNLDKQAPKTGVAFDQMMKDLEKDIMPGLLHWQHPHFHAYAPAGSSFASVCGDIVSGGLGVIGLSWETAPAIEELERVTMDWLARMLELPEDFLSNDDHTRGGIITGSASESVLMTVLAARNREFMRAREKMKQANPDWYEESARIVNLDVTKKLVAYCTQGAHLSVDRACRMGMVQLRRLQTDSKKRLHGDTLARAVAEDREQGKTPFFCVATLGTPGLEAFDDIAELGQAAKETGLWLHIDAAYAGTACICPEYRPLLNGVEHAMSVSLNPHKWLYVNFDFSALWYRDVTPLTNILKMDVPYLPITTGYDNWEIPQGRRFRALKLWFVLRMYGIEQLQERVRNHCRMANLLKEKLEEDGRFEILNISLGILCFRVLPKRSEDDKNLLTKRLYEELLERRHIFLSKSTLKNENLDFIRFVICHEYVEANDINYAFDNIIECLESLK